MFDLEAFWAKLLPYINIIFYDIKLLAVDSHRYYTGQSNRRILRNFEALHKDSDVSIVPTIPLIPGITATADNLTDIIEFLKQANCSVYELKPYNPGGIKKRMMLGNPIPPEISEFPMTAGEQEKLEEIFSSSLSSPVRQRGL
jgi:pyruvate formate lyase activating enzyme